MKHTQKLCAVGLAVSCALSQHAYANEEKTTNNGADEQEKAQQQVEKIEVRGVRSSIKESLFLKQNAVGVMDAIVAEDIGKFPDQNLAEALQRMTGIAITRNAGEGQNVTVRGLGGDYNVTTINGRRMASDHGSRNFNFDLIAPEIVQALEVYKSPQSFTQEGGIGAVINVKTRRPLDMDGFTLSGSLKGTYEERTGDTKPQASLLISDTFFDDTFGALFTAVYSERTVREDAYEGSRFYDPEEKVDVRVPLDTNRNGELDEDEVSHPSMIPGYVRYSNWQDERERIGASLAFQWRPTNDIDVTFDSLYSSYKTDGERYEMSFVTYDESWTPGIPAVGEVKFNDEGNVNYIELVDGAMAELLNVSRPRDTYTWQTGLNVAWQVTADLTLDFDISKSSANKKNPGNDRYVVARGFVDSITIDQTGSNLLPDITMSPALSAEQPFGAHYSYNYGTQVVSDVEEFRISGQYFPEWDMVKDIKFGMHYGSQTKSRDVSGSKNASMFSNGGAYFKNSKYDGFDDSTVEELGGLKLFRLPADILVPANFDNFLDGEPGQHPAPWASFDYDKLFAFYETINADAANEQIRAIPRPKDSYEVTEATLAFYLETNLVGELEEMPYNLNLGVRAVKTSLDSKGFQLDYEGLIIDVTENDKGDRTYKLRGDVEDYYSDTTIKYDYTDVLPSLNFKLNITDTLLFRTSAAKVITRPNIGFLTPNSNIDMGRKEYYEANPRIKPLRANQLDLTLEWYFSDYGALTLATYYKDIKSSIKTGRVGSAVIGKYFLDGEQVEGVEVEKKTPVTDSGAEVKGFEIAYQQSLEELLPEPFDGLGFQLNYTFTDSAYEDKEKDDLPFVGMSEHSYNAVLYYEKDDYQARIAYNWRDDYLESPNAFGGPQWRADYGQFDFSASYNITSKTRIDLNVTNLSNEKQWSYIKTEEQVRRLQRYGRTLSLGIQTSF